MTDDDEDRASPWRIDNRNPDEVAGEVCTTLQARLNYMVVNVPIPKAYRIAES
ncbi:hypothetical protein MTR_7g078835 [Medicago truncatula]|uniref:Uncharacterized protein n=1 Tax=Medicago truncatula TaxID=3880 RepID=A0A072U2K2_MEDTR|nr:hypothetical protein MTR_7g078835 [Medicago truncatula]